MRVIRVRVHISRAFYVHIHICKYDAQILVVCHFLFNLNSIECVFLVESKSVIWCYMSLYVDYLSKL